MTERPIGILICAILFAIGGILGILGGLMIFLAGGAIYTMLALRDIDPALIGMVAGILGLVCIILGAVYLAVAYGIWKMKRWARIAGIILAIIGGILVFPIGTVIAIIILYFLLIDKNTKCSFAR